jgi:small subunit ribosomal protein S19
LYKEERRKRGRSNMSRSLKKGPYIDEKLQKKVANMKAGDTATIKTWSRSASITPEMVGLSLGVHNGKDFIAVSVQEDMVGHKLGEFSPTTKFVRHGGKIQKGMEQKAKQPAKQPAAKSGPKKK